MERHDGTPETSRTIPSQAGQDVPMYGILASRWKDDDLAILGKTTVQTGLRVDILLLPGSGLL